jgi:hypothetical protein
MRFQIQMWGKGAKRLVDSLTATLYMAYNRITVHSLPHDTFIELVMRHQRVLCSMPYHCHSRAQIYLYLEGYYFSALQKPRRGGIYAREVLVELPAVTVGPWPGTVA